MMNNRLTCLSFICLFGLNAWGAPPDEITLTCRSSDVGRVEVVLSNPVQRTVSDEIAKYSIAVKYFNDRGQVFAGASYPGHVNENTAMATIDMNSDSAPLDPEPIVNVKVPAFGVYWDHHPNECYVTSAAVGFQVAVGLNSQNISTSYGRNPSVNPYDINPSVQTVIVPGPGFGTAKWVLNGKDCPRIDTWRLARDFACEVSWR